MEIAIIGGGASGLAAAIAAAEDPRCQVTLVESHGRVGRKLLATGNGRCNLANANLSMGAYHGTDPAFARPCLTRYGVESTLDFFRGLGLVTVQEPSGRIYPWSDQAASVVDVLRFALNRPNVRLLTAWPVGRVKRTAQGFSLSGPAGELTCRRLIVACGGLAGTALGGSMSGYQLLRSLGHRCSRLRPALVPLKSDYPRCPSLKGVRANCRLALRRDGQVVAETPGEVQFTQYGLSGPAVFSRGYGVEDFQRKRVGAAGYVSAEHEAHADFSQGSGQTEQKSGGQTSADQRQGDQKEGCRRACAANSRSLPPGPS